MQFAAPPEVDILTAVNLLVLATLIIVAFSLRNRARNLKAKLTQTQDLYRNVLDTQNDLICRYLPDTTLTYVNDAYCRFFGVAREKLLGMKFIELIPEYERDGALRHVRSLVDNPRTISYTHEVTRADGSVGWQRWIDQAIVEASGEVIELQGIGHDITDLKLAERQLQRQREQVVHLTRVATLGELSGALAHELNQPLTAIVNNAEAGGMLLERKSVDTGELRQILRDIETNGDRAGQIIRRLHRLLRKGEHTPGRVDVPMLISEAINLVHGPLLDQNIRTVLDVAEECPAVLGDRVQLLQVMLNLLLNASAAMATNAADNRELRITAAPGEFGVMISVADNGCGFAPGVEESLFDPFFTTRDDSLGLGLCVCQSIVTAHGGQLEAWNNDGQGAVFSFVLPQFAADEESSPPAADS